MLHDILTLKYAVLKLTFYCVLLRNVCLLMFNKVVQLYIPLHSSLRMVKNEPKHVGESTI